jgi:hypothetical protein
MVFEKLKTNVKYFPINKRFLPYCGYNQKGKGERNCVLHRTNAAFKSQETPFEDQIEAYLSEDDHQLKMQLILKNHTLLKWSQQLGRLKYLKKL